MPRSGALRQPAATFVSLLLLAAALLHCDRLSLELPCCKPITHTRRRSPVQLLAMDHAQNRKRICQSESLWRLQASTEAFLGTSGGGQQTGRSRTASLVHQSAVGKLVNFLAEQGQPDPLLSVLRAVETDGQQLPAEASQDRDAEGRSFLTRWMPSWIQSQQPDGPSMPEGGQHLDPALLAFPLVSIPK